MADKHIWLTPAASAALAALSLKWGLSHSATIARALEQAAAQKH